MKYKNGSNWLADKQNRDRLAIGLGWFSIGLGLTEILAPRTLSRMIGAPPRSGLIRLLGFREIMAGVGILSKPRTRAWLQTRVAGDAMDLSLLGAAAFSKESDLGRLTMAAATVSGVTALDVIASKSFRNGESVPTTLHVKHSIIVNRPPEELYKTWHNFEGLPCFMRHLISVKKEGENRWHWIAKGPAGTRVEWDAEVIDDRLNEAIVWRSIGNADVNHAGAVRFERAAANRGTIVRVEMEYRPPVGRIGARVAKMLGQSPEKQVRVDLLRFKQWAETGEVARTEGQPAGRYRSMSLKYDDLVRA